MITLLKGDYEVKSQQVIYTLLLFSIVSTLRLQQLLVVELLLRCYGRLDTPTYINKNMKKWTLLGQDSSHHSNITFTLIGLLFGIIMWGLLRVIICHLHEIWSEFVYDGTESHSIAPRGRHVRDLDPLVTFGDLLAPIKQILSGCEVTGAWRVTAALSLQTKHGSDADIQVIQQSIITQHHG